MRVRPHLARFVLFVSASLLTALLPAASADAAVDRVGAFEWGLADQDCATSGGDENLGFVRAQAHVKEYGRSGTNYMRVRFERQVRSEGVWTTDALEQKQSAKQADTRKSRSFGPSHRFSFSLGDAILALPTRVLLTISWWKTRSGADRKLFERTVRTSPCTPVIVPPE